jgi:hypothetical protein
MMKVYAAEINDGLKQQLTSPEAGAAVALARIDQSITSDVFVCQRDLTLASQALGLEADNFDLYPIHTILVSTGWNRNDDIFDAKETWGARKSPEDKPFNLEHDPNKIIGHITGSVPVDQNYQVLADDADLPDKFHILTRSVIYKHVSSRDQTLQEEVANLIQGISNNEWFVSMEALFSNFDYGFIYPDGNQRVIARQESTAFLTKHLRRFGGTGEYDGGRVGRVLRGITFSGKGLVRNPANPNSIIFNDTEIFKGVLANETQTKNFVIGAFNMSEEILRELKDKNAGLEQKLADATRKLEEMGEAAVQAKLDAKDGTIDELKTKVEAHVNTITELKASVQDLEKSRDEAVAAKIEAEEGLKKAQEQIEASEAETLKTSRISVLVDKGVDKAAAEELVAEFDMLDDDKFNKLVEIQAELLAAKCSGDKEKDEKDEKSKKSDAEETEQSEEQEDEEGAEAEAETEETLSEAEEEKDAAMASDETSEDDDKQLQDSIASYLGGWLGDRKQDGGN